jgi:hypothetical protein
LWNDRCKLLDTELLIGANRQKRVVLETPIF